MDQIILAIVEPLIGKLGEYLVNPIKKQVSYLCCYSCNVERLAHEVPGLNAREEIVQQDVNAAKDNMEVIEPVVETWLSRVHEVQEKSTRICNDAAEVQQSCLSKWCRPLHYCLSREAQKTTEASIRLQNTRFERISHPVNPADLEPIPDTSVIAFESRESTEKEIMDALKDDSVYLIGLCGMGGVGKTTMAKKIEMRAREKTEDSGPMFQNVIMVVVSQQLDKPEVQKQIAEGLGLKEFEKQSPTIRARLLHARVKAAKSTLIILDDVWEWLNLEELGIPSQSTHAGCKLILTTRDETVLNITEGRKIFSLGILTDEESWILFTKNVGYSIDSSDLQQIAKDVVKECNGLPLALVTVGRALRGLSKSSWEDALLGLQKPIPTNIPEVFKGVYRPLCCSYNQLESDEYRYLFLLCCLFPEDSDISIEALEGFGKGLGIFAGVENMRQARNRVERIVENLINRSLLTKSSRDWWMGNPCVKMHDVIRDMGIWIASEGQHVFMISHGKNEWPTSNEDSYGNYTCISLIFSEANVSVPECIKCSRLELLRMDFGDRQRMYFRDRGSQILPENFFGGMRGLKVLEASGIKSLPSSINLLYNLRTLRLSRCKLEMTSIIGELINLEILSFIRCDFKVLPEEIGRLRKLRKLDINDCWCLKRIAFGVLSRLVELEELVIRGSFRNWEAEEKDKEMKNASLAELDSSSHLTTLHIEISAPNAIPKKMPLWAQKVMKYSIYVAEDWLWSNNSEFQTAIFLDYYDVTSLGYWFCNMAGDAECLDLKGPICTNVVNSLVRSGYQNLKRFSLRSCNDIQLLRYAFAEGKQNAIFPILKRLEIGYSCSLQEISSGPLPIGSFEALEEIRLKKLSGLVRLWTFPGEKLCLYNLKVAKISHCGSLFYLFPLSIVESLSQLQEFKVSDCQVMKEIFRKEEGGMEITFNKIKFPKLRELSFKHLPSLCGFSQGIDRIEVPTLRRLIIGDLPNTMREADHDVHQQLLFDHQVSGNSLDILNPLGMLFNFSGLQTLRVGSFHNFKSLFSPSILSGFTNLKELHIENCSTLEEVIGKEENVGETKTKRTLFPQLQTLVLSSLPKIHAFCHTLGDLELPVLEELHIEDCPMMETFIIPRIGTGVSDSKHVIQPLFSREVLCPKLKTLNLTKLNMAGISGHSIPLGNFCGLEELNVQSCHRMSNLFSPPIFRGLTNIRELRLADCEELEEVIAKEDQEGPTNIKEILSPQLNYLLLRGLPNMQRFCHMNNDLELPSLETVEIDDCPMLETFSPGPLHLPSFKRLDRLLDRDFASKFFFKKEKSSDEIFSKNNCFTLSARELSIDFQPNDGRMLSWFLAPDSSDSFVTAAELHYVSSVEITGKFETVKLQPGVVYEIIFMIIYGSGWEAVNLKLTLPGGIAHHTEILDKKQRGEWIEILIGEFRREPPQIGLLEFSLYMHNNQWKEGLIIKGVTIRMKG